MKLRYADEASRRHRWPLEVIEDAGHVVFIDQRDAVITALTRALDAK